MDRADKLKKLRRMLEQVAPQTSLESVGSGLEASGIGEEDINLINEGMEGLSREQDISTESEHALEAIVLKQHRPVVNIIGNTFNDPPSPWQHLGQEDIKKRLHEHWDDGEIVEMLGVIALFGYLNRTHKVILFPYCCRAPTPFLNP